MTGRDAMTFALWYILGLWVRYIANINRVFATARDKDPSLIDD
jgi:hypothetical protein